MRRLFRKRWLGLPIGIIATALIGIAVLALVLINVTQHIGQELVDEEPPTDYGSISAPSFDLANVTVGGAVSHTAPDSVVVVLEAAGEGKVLHLILDDTTTTLYGAYEVSITSLAADNPTAADITLTVTSGGTLDDSIALTDAGTYTFDETITATAGGVTGTADVIVDVSLSDA